jgi:hypothetical protein
VLFRSLLNPVVFLSVIGATVLLWKRQNRSALLVYLFSMGAPLFLLYLFYTLRSRVQPNWIAPAVLPLLCLAVVYWEGKWREGSMLVQHGLLASVLIGWLVVVPLHDTKLVGKMFGKSLTVQQDPLTRVQGWKEMARVVRQAWLDLNGEGKPAFIIANHYGTTSLLTFYIPEARTGIPDQPLVYFISTGEPKNQFYFWPGYQMRKGENAIFIGTVDRSERDAPESLRKEFASVTDLGMRDILYRDKVFHQIQLFACRGFQGR